MRIPTVILCLLLCGLTACSSVTGEPERSTTLEASTPPSSADGTADDAADGSGPATAEASPPADDPMAAATAAEATEAPGGIPVSASARSRQQARARAAELSVWNDPGFRKRFVESYLAETDIEPTVDTEERDTMIEVIDLISQDKLDEAAVLIEAATGDSASAAFDFTLANIRFQQERFADAAQACETAVEKFPKYRRAWRLLGQVRVRDGAPQLAIDALTRVIELGGADAVTYGMLGFSYASTQDYLPAESAFRFALLLDPHTTEWKLGLADALYRQERFGEAITFFDRLIADNPGKPELWLAQGEAYARSGQPQKAAENFEMAHGLGGGSYDSMLNLGDIYANQELYDVAVDTYLRAIDEQPDGSIDRVLLAAKYISANGALAESRRLADGIEATHGDRLDVDQRKDLLRLRARLAVAEGAGDEEAHLLEEIVELDPLDGDALILLGQHANRSGDPEQAIFYFERAAGMEAFEADAKVRHAQVLVGQGKYADALPLLRRAQSLKPRDNIREYLEQVERIAQARS